MYTLDKNWYKLSLQCLKNNLNLCVKTKPTVTRMEVGATVFFWVRVGHVLLHSLNYVTQFLCGDSVDF